MMDKKQYNKFYLSHLCFPIGNQILAAKKENSAAD